MPNDPGDQRNQGVIVIEEERLRERFTQIPNTILRRPDVTPGAKLTYVVLLSYAWQDDSCFPGQAVLARDTGVSRRSVVTYLQELQEKGLLAVKRRGLGQTNIYTLTRWDTSRSAEFAHQEVKNPSHPEVQNLRAKNTHRKNTHTNNTQDSNSFEGKISHQRDVDSSASRNRKFAKNQFVATGAEPPARDSRAAPTPLGAALTDRYGDRPLEGPSAAPGSSVRVTNPPQGIQSQVEGVSSPLRASSGRGRPPKAPSQIRAYIEQFSGELHDDDHVPSNVGQAARLWKASGLDEAAFVSLLFEARSITKQYDITKRADGEAGRWGARNKMPYYFAVLRDLLGMKEERQGNDRPPPSTNR